MKITSIFSTAPEQAANQLQTEHAIVMPNEIIQEATGEQSRQIKNIIGSALMILILFCIFFTRQGATFMFGTTGTILVWVLGLLSVAGVFAYIRGALPARLKYLVLFLEVMNLGFDTYVAGGQWGRADIDAKVIVTLNERQTASEQYVGDINGLITQHNGLAKTAETIKDIESARDGKGTVYEAAAKMEAEFAEIAALPTLTYTPVTKEQIKALASAEDLLAFVVTSQREMIDQEQKLGETAKAILAKASSFKSYLDTMQVKMTTGYSQERLANLERLKSAVKEVSSYKMPTPSAMISWSKNDLYKSIRWLDRVIVPLVLLLISLVLIIVLWFWGGKGADRSRFDREASTHLAQAKVLASGLQHSLPSPWEPELLDMQLLDLWDDPIVLQQVKRTALSYEALRQSYQTLGSELFLRSISSTTTWSLRQISVLSETYPGEATMIVNRLTPAQWEMLTRYVNRPTDVLRLSDDALKHVIDLIGTVRVKLHGRDEEINQTVDRLFVEYADDAYYRTLFRLIDISDNPVQIAEITPRAVQAIRPEIVETIIALFSGVGDDQFREIMRRWQVSDSDILVKLQQAKLLSPLQPVLSHCARGGYGLLKMCLDHSDTVITEARRGLITQTVNVNPTTAEDIQRLLDPALVRTALPHLFVIS